ncbi:SAM-dependent methyltransferase [Frankia sp. AiPs1]|uniref:SAM-dependent methyltransferase n=1 Tax=Frankia sp. AiPs1 TaxID=573493 RepID=UPI0020431367|nr:SAM-dependent methyltransferase [Frankia sp. AiPs1]MCM3920759.1 SAM-dependent methyltransferase [Frankia sp. AiPs1]
MTETGGRDLTGGRWWQSLVEERNPVDLKTDQPHSARMYDYFLGGKDNFPADREAAEQSLAAFPNLRLVARENRAFLARTVRFLAGEVGIRQFLDIGTGIPTSPNLHEIAQGIAPDARVVYADNDPIVLTHARALLTGTPQGATAYLDVDVRDVEGILSAVELRDTLDVTKPIALSLIALFHFVPDSDDPYGIVRRLVDALPVGSYLALSHITADEDPGWEQVAETYRSRGIPLQPRTRAQVARFFDGLELVEPGVQVVHRWRPDGTATGLTDLEVSNYGAVGRKV